MTFLVIGICQDNKICFVELPAGLEHKVCKCFLESPHYLGTLSRLNNLNNKRRHTNVNFSSHFFLLGWRHLWVTQIKRLSYEEKGEWSVCRYADEREVADGDEGGQHGAEDDGGVNRFLPVVGTFEAHDELEKTKTFSLTEFVCFSFVHDFENVLWYLFTFKIPWTKKNKFVFGSFILVKTVFLHV